MSTNSCALETISVEGFSVGRSLLKNFISLFHLKLFSKLTFARFASFGHAMSYAICNLQLDTCAPQHFLEYVCIYIGRVATNRAVGSRLFSLSTLNVGCVTHVINASIFIRAAIATDASVRALSIAMHSRQIPPFLPSSIRSANTFVLLGDFSLLRILCFAFAFLFSLNILDTSGSKVIF